MARLPQIWRNKSIKWRDNEYFGAIQQSLWEAYFEDMGAAPAFPTHAMGYRFALVSKPNEMTSRVARSSPVKKVSMKKGAARLRGTTQVVRHACERAITAMGYAS